MPSTTVGVDIAKNVIQLHYIDAETGEIINKPIKRAAFLEQFANRAPCLIGMEACGGSHYWARVLSAQGHTVKLIAPQYVKPFVKRGKNDRNDAEAIVEAVSRPTMRFVSIKSVEQEDIQAVHRMRAILVRQRTAVINQIRGLLAERGLIIARSPQAFKRAMPILLCNEGSELTAFCQALLTEMLHHLQALEARIHWLEVSIKEFVKNSELCRKITAVEGVGPLTATAIVGAIGDAKQFSNGRHLAAWLGLVPRQYSSGGKARLQGISKSV